MCCYLSLFFFFPFSFQQVILKVSFFPTPFLKNAICVCQPELHPGVINVHAALFVTFLCTAFLSPLAWVCFHSYGMLFGPSLCLSSPAGGGCHMLLLLNLFCLREFCYSTKQVAFSDKAKVLSLFFFFICCQRSPHSQAFGVWESKVAFYLFAYFR